MNNGDVVADFELPDETGTKRRLSEFLAKGPVVLFFYPAAMTMGCTRESCHFRDLKSEFEGLGAQRVGISADTVRSRSSSPTPTPSTTRCCRTPTAPWPQQFGVKRGLNILPNKRATFVIGTDSKVIAVINSEVNMAKHADAALEVLRAAGAVTRGCPRARRRRPQPMWSAGMVPSLPCWKSSRAWAISARVFMTKGP